MEIKLWRELLEPYQLAVDELLIKFRHLSKEYQIKGEYSPIESVQGRVKSISSILEKLHKKNIDIDDFEASIDDLAGIRIMCQFVEDIDKVVELIRAREDMSVIWEKDYINHGKASGYRSYHLILHYMIYTIDGTKDIKVEVQIRTMAMNFWSTVEHSLQYKYKGNIPEHIRAKLLSASRAIEQLDNEMSSVRSEIMDAQNYLHMKETVTSDILKNIQNLYRVTNKREVVKIQDEFMKVYALDDLEKLQFFNKQLDVIAEGYHAQQL